MSLSSDLKNRAFSSVTVAVSGQSNGKTPQHVREFGSSYVKLFGFYAYGTSTTLRKFCKVLRSLQIMRLLVFTCIFNKSTEYLLLTSRVSLTGNLLVFLTNIYRAYSQDDEDAMMTHGRFAQIFIRGHISYERNFG
jgi:hypothetical protein